MGLYLFAMWLWATDAYPRPNDGADPELSHHGFGRLRVIKVPEKEDRCSICHPDLPISPYLCRRHKLAGLELSKSEGIRFSEAAGRLHLEARQSAGSHG